jgi:hypothetical protein
MHSTISKRFFVIGRKVVYIKHPGKKKEFIHYKKHDAFNNEGNQLELHGCDHEFNSDNCYKELFTDASVNPPGRIELPGMLTAPKVNIASIVRGFLNPFEMIES